MKPATFRSSSTIRIRMGACAWAAAGGAPAASVLRGPGGFEASVVLSPASPPPPRSASPVAQRARGLGAHLLHGARLLVGIALLRPGVRVHVVAVLLPEARGPLDGGALRSEEHTSELQSHSNFVCPIQLII